MYIRTQVYTGACYLLVIRSPDPTGDLTFQVYLRGPVSLPADGSHQHETIAVRDESLSAIVRPGEVAHLEKTDQMHEWKSFLHTHTHIAAQMYYMQRMYCPSYLCPTVIHQLHRPATFVLNPNKYSSICIASGQFLEGLIPSHQNHLMGRMGGKKKTNKQLSLPDIPGCAV